MRSERPAEIPPVNLTDLLMPSLADSSSRMVSWMTRRLIGLQRMERRERILAHPEACHDVTERKGS